MNKEQARQKQRDFIEKTDKLFGVVREYPPTNEYLDQRIIDDKIVIEIKQRQYNELKKREK